MRLPRLQFSLGRMMIAVALAGVGCCVFVMTESAIKPLLILCLGPLVGACWRRLFTLDVFDPSTRPTLMRSVLDPVSGSQDRLTQSIDGGIKGGLIEAVIIAVATVVPIAFSRDMGFLQLGLPALFWLGFIVLVALCFWLMLSLMAGLIVGILVGLLAETVRVLATGWQENP